MTNIITGEDWRERSACRTAPNPHIFFPWSRRQTVWAAAYCQVCPVADRCEQEGQHLLNTAAPYLQDNPRLLEIRHPVGVRNGVDLTPIAGDVRIGRIYKTEPTPTGYAHYPRSTRTAPAPEPPLTDTGRKPARRCLCEWCDRPFKSEATNLTFWNRGMFCSPRCRTESLEMTVTDTQGNRYRLCQQCDSLTPAHKTLPIPKPTAQSADLGHSCQECYQQHVAETKKHKIAKRWAYLEARYSQPGQNGHLNIPCSSCGALYELTTPRNKFPRGGKCGQCKKKPGPANSYTHTCIGCGKSRVVSKAAKAKQSYCSVKCSNYHQAQKRRKTVTLRCQHCRKEYEIAASRISKHYPRKYCTFRCAKEAQPPQWGKPVPPLQPKPCAYRECGTMFKPEVNGGRSKHRRYCSRRCSDADNSWRGPYQGAVPCHRCGCDIAVTMWSPPYAKLGGGPDTGPQIKPYEYTPRYCKPCRLIKNRQPRKRQVISE